MLLNTFNNPSEVFFFSRTSGFFLSGYFYNGFRRKPHKVSITHYLSNGPSNNF